MDRTWYSTASAAEYVACSPDVLRDAVKAGQLRAKRKGTKPKSPLIFRREWLDDWAENTLPDA